MFEKRFSSIMENFIRRGIALVLCTALILGTFVGLDLRLDLNLFTSKSVDAEAAEGQSMTNTYLLSVTTGSDSGNGEVLFIAVDYYTDSGKKCTEYVFPTEDSLYESYRKALSVSATDKSKPTTESLVSQALNATGTKINGIDSFKGKAFDAYSCNDFLFTPVFPIKQIERVRVMTQCPDNKSGSWALASLQIFKVDVLYGLKMYGYVSSDYFVDFKGSILATYTGSTVLSWNVDHVFFIDPGSKTMMLDVSDPADASSSSGKAASRDAMVTNYDRHTQPLYYFKADIADVYMSGIEEMSSNALTKFEDLKFSSGFMSEKLLLRLKYQDLFGYRHELYLPVVTSAYLWQLNNATDEVKGTKVMGFAQQGDTILFPLNLPDCSSVLECHLTYGSEVAGKNWKSQKNTATAFGDEDKTVRFESIQIYKSETASDFIPSVRVTTYTDDSNNTVKTNHVEVSVSTSLSPYRFETAPDYTGIEFVNGKEKSVNLKNWNEVSQSDRVIKRRRSFGADTYLVAITTDEYAGAATTEDAYMKVHFQNNNDNEASSNEIAIGKAARDFYGYWPSATADLAYINGTGANQVLYFMISLKNAKSITGITVYFKGEVEDDWQIKNIEIFNLKSMSERYITANPSEVTYHSEYKTNWNITRVVKTTPVYDTGGRIIYLGTRDEEKSKTVKSTSEEVIENQETIEWDKIRYSMTYEEATQGLNYANTRASYTVTVNVNKAIDNGTDEDSGSTNNFYFQLVFEGGSSAYVLANQQLTADGFHPGSQSFKIKTNQNYGELVAVNIIPDDLIGENTDPYDKLNIDSIEVSKDTAGGMNVCWVIEDIGWVEINYVDDGSKQNGGARGRSASEMARNYLVSYKKNSINLQFMITLGDFSNSDTDESGNQRTTVKYFDGIMTAKLQYYDTQGVLQETEFDIVQNIFDYAGKTPKYDAPGVNTYAGNAISDSKWMLQPNSTDRFIVTVQNLSQLYSITVYAMTPTTAVILPIKSIGVQTITKESRGMSYGPDGKLVKDNGACALCETDNEAIVKMYLPYGTMQEREFKFTEHTITLDEAASTWSSTVSREPASQNDVINMYVYMTGNSTKMKSENGYVMSSTVEYTTTYGVTKKLSISKLRPDPENNLFYISEQNAPALASIKNISLKATDKKTITANVDHVVIQQVRSGVVIDTFYIQFAEGTWSAGQELGIIGSPIDKDLIRNEKQNVMIQFSQETEKSKLVSLGRDIAVALLYRTKGDSSNTKTYMSRYVFLTDQGLSEITPGQVVSVGFDEMNVDEIVGVKIKATGSINVAVDKAIIVRSIKDEAGVYNISQYFNITDGAPLGKSEVTFKPSSEGINKAETLVPVTIEFKTAERQVDYESGTDDPIKVAIEYEVITTGEFAEVAKSTIEVADLQKCITSGSTDTGATAKVTLFIPGINKLRGMTIANGASDPVFGWSIESIKAKFYPGADETKKERTYDRIIDKRVTNSNNVTINFADIIVTAQVYLSHDGAISNPFNLQNGTTSYYLNESGYSLMGDISVVGSEKGVSIDAVEVDDKNHAVSANEYLSFSETTGILTFTPPTNETSEPIDYEITISSVEAPSKQCKISIGVKGTARQPENQGQGEGTGGTNDNPVDWGSDGEDTEGGSTEGGSTEGGSTEGGSTEGGSTEGGSTEGGSTEGGSTEGGSTEGESTEGGSTEGGSTEGGSTEGGSTEGGSI